MAAREIPAPIRQDTRPEQHTTLSHYRRPETELARSAAMGGSSDMAGALEARA
jgi:hypothetical protein